MITYFEIGRDRELNEIVVAGTHDAGITSGGDGVQTQSHNIMQQALVGVRFFDVRIAAAVTSQTHSSGRPVAELRAFHADDKVVMKLERNVVLKGSDNPVRVKQSKLAGGAFGMGLTTMLDQARAFVTSAVGRNEFLILKFDKSTNWAHIANACWTILGTSMYTAGGNINRKTLGDLAGKVVVLFSPKGLSELQGTTGGILSFKNLTEDGATYDRTYPGLQYYGKGGTSPFNPINKLKQNIKKQTKLMRGAAGMQDPEVIGMMYWTTTGLIESIKKRDDGMWDTPNIAKMKKLWEQGLGDFVNARVSLPDTNPMTIAQQRRSYFPNIVMVDFADQAKCQRIRDLNDLTVHHLSVLP
ncbi:MAG TPA: hypothetical protein VK636_03030 [Gemmatimonadaceae bacterium]|nr:hypothetical protein [Gemmatimonadaceae bacterium]